MMMLRGSAGSIVYFLDTAPTLAFFVPQTFMTLAFCIYSGDLKSRPFEIQTFD